MKELSIKEKAEAYDYAVNKAKELILNENGVVRVDKPLFDELFPSEMEESEDERIRQRIIHALHGDVLEMSEIKEAIDWLERQGEMDMESYKAAEDEKREFVGDGFIKCYADFQDFKEGETYWLEYVGNDNYNVRSDNLLSKTYHITPCQLYTIFKKMTWLEKQGKKKPYKEDFHDLLMDVKFGIEPSPKQGEKKSFDYENANMQQNDFAPKSAIEATKEEKVDNANKVEPFDKYEGLTDFERTLADICMGWIGEEHGWKQYIKDNADVLLRIAVKMFNSVQDAPFEQEPAENEELTEFDKAVGVSIGTWNPKSPEQIQSVKAVSKKLLKLAKKQINDEQKPAEWSEEDVADAFKDGIAEGEKELLAKAWDETAIKQWFIVNVDSNEPVWTDAHIEELYKDFIIIKKEE